MAYQPTDPYRAPLSEEEIARQARLNSLDNEIQPDPMLDDGGPSGTKVAMFAVAIAVVWYVIPLRRLAYRRRRASRD